MSARAGNWLMAFGGVVILISLCFVPAIVGDRTDTSLLGAGASLFSFGALAVAAGTYLKAKLLQPATAEIVLPARRPRGGCDLCKGEAPVIQCKVHQLHLCPTCLAEHYDFRSCAYVPSTRGKVGKTLARAHGA
jgi:hypothetical protein